MGARGPSPCWAAAPHQKTQRELRGAEPQGPRAPLGAVRRGLHSCLPGSRDARRGHVATSSVTRKAARVSFQLDSRRARRPDRTRIRVTWRQPDVTGAVNADDTRLGSGNRTAFEADAGAASAPRSPRVGGALGPSAHSAAPPGTRLRPRSFLVRAPARPGRVRRPPRTRLPAGQRFGLIQRPRRPGKTPLESISTFCSRSAPPRPGQAEAPQTARLAV